MPNHPLEVCPAGLTIIFINLVQRWLVVSNAGGVKRTTRSHPTTRLPTCPLPFLMSTGRLAIRAITGYPFSVPKEESCVLSAYSSRHNIFTSSSNDDFGVVSLIYLNQFDWAYLNIPETVPSPWFGVRSREPILSTPENPLGVPFNVSYNIWIHKVVEDPIPQRP